jgi:hypothetical protein
MNPLNRTDRTNRSLLNFDDGSSDEDGEFDFDLAPTHEEIAKLAYQIYEGLVALQDVMKPIGMKQNAS